MRIYKISSAKALRKVIPALRQEKARASAENAAAVWSVAARQGKPDAFRFYIKIGRSATLCRDRDGKVGKPKVCQVGLADRHGSNRRFEARRLAEIVIGDMNVKEARAMATELMDKEGAPRRRA